MRYKRRTRQEGESDHVAHSIFISPRYLDIVCLASSHTRQRYGNKLYVRINQTLITRIRITMKKKFARDGVDRFEFRRARTRFGLRISHSSEQRSQLCTVLYFVQVHNRILSRAASDLPRCSVSLRSIKPNHTLEFDGPFHWIVASRQLRLSDRMIPRASNPGRNRLAPGKVLKSSHAKETRVVRRFVWTMKQVHDELISWCNCDHGVPSRSLSLSVSLFLSLSLSPLSLSRTLVILAHRFGPLLRWSDVNERLPGATSDVSIAASPGKDGNPAEKPRSIQPTEEKRRTAERTSRNL